MKTAKVFKSGNSQAVRLPREFQLDVKEVGIFQKDGNLILIPLKKTWKDYFDHGEKFSGDFPEQIEDPFPEERFLW
ncbi:MAG: antitoxin [Proteobacteria bacterium]|nr:antitoxin [Pseudomonadota bacterium]